MKITMILLRGMCSALVKQTNKDRLIMICDNLPYRMVQHLRTTIQDNEELLRFFNTIKDDAVYVHCSKNRNISGATVVNISKWERYLNEDNNSRKGKLSSSIG